MGQSFPVNIDPIPGYRFTVFLNAQIMGFKKVSGIAREVETESYREGGLNTRVHIFPKAYAGEKALLLEKGTYGGIRHPFYLVGEQVPGVLTLAVMNNLGMPLKTYIFDGLLVKKWEVGELSAEDNSLLIDRFEISYEDFCVVI